MSMEYAVSKIKEALRLTHGNAARARQQVIAWSHEDARLLHALTKPHLTGIVAYQVERVLSGRADAASADKAASNDKPVNLAAVPAKTREQEDRETLGREILKVLGGSGGAMFGTEAYGGQSLSSKPRAVSKSHTDAIRLIASKSRKK